MTEKAVGSLRGRVVAITGASQGLGAVLSRRMTSEGASVVMMARSRDRLEHLAAELGPSSMALPCDVSDAGEIAAAFERIDERHGRLDILVNNAAVIAMAMLESSSESSVSDQVAINLTGPILCSRAAIPLLRAGGGGHIVNISSRSVELARPSLSVYAATKGGLETFTRTLAAELRPVGIKVSAIRVGPLATAPPVEVGDRQTDEVVRDWVARGGPAPEPPAPAESVADAVVFITTTRVGARIPILHVEPE